MAIPSSNFLCHTLQIISYFIPCFYIFIVSTTKKKLKLNNHLAMINTIVLWDPIKPKPPESMLIIIRNDMQIFIPPVPDPNFDFLILSLLWFQVRKARVNPVVHPCSCFERTTMMSDTRWKVILCFQHVCIPKSSERNESGSLNCIKFRDSCFFFSIRLSILMCHCKYLIFLNCHPLQKRVRWRTVVPMYSDTCVIRSPLDTKSVPLEDLCDSGEFELYSCEYENVEIDWTDHIMSEWRKLFLVEYRLEMIACIVGDESFAIFLFNKYFNCYRKWSQKSLDSKSHFQFVRKQKLPLI